MSIRVMTQVWDAENVKPHELLVMLVLADHASDDGTNAWPAVATIAKKVRRTPRSVQQTLKELRERGLIEVEWNEGGDHRTTEDRRPNRYTIRLDRLKATDNGVKPTSPRAANGVKPTSQRGEAHFTHGVKPTSPKPSLNHPEPSSTSRAEEPGWTPPPDDVKAQVRQLLGGRT